MTWKLLTGNVWNYQRGKHRTEKETGSEAPERISRFFPLYFSFVNLALVPKGESLPVSDKERPGTRAETVGVGPSYRQGETRSPGSLPE